MGEIAIKSDEMYNCSSKRIIFSCTFPGIAKKVLVISKNHNSRGLKYIVAYYFVNKTDSEAKPTDWKRYSIKTYHQ